MDKQIQALRKQKSCIKEKLTKIANFVKAVTGETTLAEIQSRITSCHELLKQFNDYDEKIIMLNPEEDGDLTFEDDYHTTVAMVMTWARKKSVAEQAAPALEADNTLSFNTTQFNLSTESDLKPSAAQKFQYLKSLLDGEAASLLRHLLVTENNYKIALTKLQDRYDRKRHIITAFIRKFIDQPNIHHSNTNALKKLMDTSEEVVRGLEALGSCAEARHTWLIYLLLEKLDDQTRAAWANHSMDSEDPKFVDFIKFLSRRIDALETITSTTKRYSSRNDAKGHVTTQNDESFLSSATLSYKCAYCSSQDHSVLQCDKFRALDIDKRIQFIRDDHRCFNCLSKSHQVSRCSSHRNCQKCNRRHHTLLHQMQTASHSVSITDEVLSDKVVTDEDDEFNGITAVCNSISQCLAVLPTISLKVINSTGGVSTCRALLDSGSQISLIANSCVQRLNLNKEYSSLSISGVGQSNSEKTKGLVRLSLKTENQTILQMVAFVLPRITCRLPAQSFAVDMKHIKTVQLADPQFNQKSEVDILIGADFFFEIIRDGIKRIANSQLYLQNTIFGWMVAGRKSNHKLESNESVALLTSMDLIQLDTTLRLFWEVESVGDGKAILSPEEKMCDDHFVENTIRHKNGRFIVKLPFRTATIQIGNTYNIALRRFHSLENRFSRNLEFKKMYSEFMNEYISLGHMVEITPPHVTDQSYYLPHHGVLKSTNAGSKLRVVFDGSAQPYEGKSLNSCLAVGPTVQASLFSILLRFRERRYVFSTDVEKMYRQILRAEVDTDFQRIIWRDDPSNEIKHYRLQTVTYGLSSAPFLATRALKQIAIDVVERYPKVTATINECVYVGDIMTGADTIEEASTIRNDLKGILSEYGFELRKWKSNCEKLLQDIPPDHCEAREKQLMIQHRDDRNTVKILGLCWDPQTDEITFNVNLPHHAVHSKWTALSDASRLFDPVGWAAPVVIRMNIFVQQLWMKNLEWDDPLPDNLKTEWLQLREDLLLANSMSIPRHLTTISTSIIELHGFCDASKLAYAAAVYFKISTASETTVRLITAKTKVAPTKQLSIPKLELAGALLLSRLLKNVMAETRIALAQIHA